MKDNKTIKELSLAELKPFTGHPYKVRDDEEMDALVESVREHGVMVPLIVRPIETGFEIVSGHRRAHAAMRAGLKTVPVIEAEFTRDEAAVALVDSNLNREHILPSEKAFAYKLKLEALARQGKRTDLTSRQLGEKWSVTQVSEAANESERQVHRYIRLTRLIPALLDMVDSERIAFSVGVELSFLDPELQASLVTAIELNDCTPSYSQANRMHKAANAGTLDEDELYSIMSEEKPNQRETVKLPLDRLLRFVPGGDTDRLEDFVFKACAFYSRHLQRTKEEER